MKSINSEYPGCRHYFRFIAGLVAYALLSATVCPIYASDLIQVQISGDVQVDDENILLGHIAKIEGGDPQLIHKLSGIVVGRAPLPGNSRKLDGASIRIRYWTYPLRLRFPAVLSKSVRRKLRGWFPTIFQPIF